MESNGLKTGTDNNVEEIKQFRMILIKTFCKGEPFVFDELPFELPFFCCY